MRCLDVAALVIEKMPHPKHFQPQNNYYVKTWSGSKKPKQPPH